MHIKGILGTLAVVALMIMLGTHAEAQLAKQGTYAGKFGWHSMGDTTTLPDEGSSYWIGQFNGAFFNEAGSGFLHNTSVICPASASIVDGANFYMGTCLITDQDGDNIVLTWNCSFNAEGACPGQFDWVHGTGKYTGITGKNTFTGFTIHKGPQGYSDWNGEWRLP
jgi:hypothetical protein